MNEVTALILAAGKGTRMKSDTAKVLHPLLGRPLLSYPLDACRQAGVKQLVAVIGYQAEEVRQAFQAPDLTFAVQENQLGTAHAVLAAREALGERTGTLLILCGDVPLIRSATLSLLVAEHCDAGALATVLTMRPSDPAGYGRVMRAADGRPERIVEERDATESVRGIGEVNTGTYAVELPWLWEALEGVDASNRQGEFYLTDVIASAARLGRAHALVLSDPNEVMGINSRVQLAEATAALRTRINRAWMEAGVTLEEPETTWIEPGAVLEPDVRIGPGCRIEGRCRIATGAALGQGVVITDSEVAPSARVLPYCVIANSRIGPGAQVGPFAHLRPGAVLEDRAKVGNFVEMKKSTLGIGSKANHLSYLGDTTVGEGANIGAGTITCNYDGSKKYPTRIGDRAFVGSNTSLVAPIDIGADATVAAGSTLTTDVPAASLGVARSRQRNVANWKARKGGSPGKG